MTHPARRFLSAPFAVAAVAMIGAPALAMPVNPGDVVALSGTTVAASPDLAGIVRNDNLIPYAFPITGFSNVSGNVQNRVVQSDNLGTMIFAPRIRDVVNIATVNFHILGFQLDGYEGWDTDIDFRTDGLGDVGPDSVSRSVDGDLLNFRYSSDPLDIGGLVGSLREESLFPSILTDAPSFALTGSMTIFGWDPDSDTTYTTRIEGLAVPAAIPLPATGLLLIAGFGGLAALRRRKRA